MTTKTGIIYLQKDRFQLYSPYLSNILEFRFVPEISRDFDLYNKELFDNLLKAFVVNNKIPAGSFYILIADNASFIKDFIVPVQQAPAVPTLEDLQNEAKEFLEHIPFDEIAGKTYPLPNGVRAYGTNQEMFESIKTALEKQGFIIEIVIPGFVFGQEVSTLSTLNINTINIIFQKINLVKEYNLLANPKIANNLVMPEESEEKSNSSGEAMPEGKKENKKLVLIIGISVLVIIFAITGFIIYSQFASLSHKNIPVVANPKPTKAAVISPTVTTVEVKDLTAQIINASSSAVTAEAVKTALIPYRFKTVTLQNQETLGAAQMLLIFSPKVGLQIKNSVTIDIRKILGNVLVQEKTDTTADITVIIGK